MQSSLKEEQGILFYFVTHNHWALSTVIWNDTFTFIRKFPRQQIKHHIGLIEHSKQCQPIFVVIL